MTASEGRKAINVTEFADTFLTGHVRAQITLDGADGFAVEERYGSSRDLLGGLFTVWYTVPDGRQADWHHPEAAPLRVRDAACGTAVWTADRRRRLDAFEKAFQAQTEPVQLVLPVLRAAPGRDLILDGTHRAVAAYAAEVPVTLFVFALHGPLRPVMLPDLRHHLRFDV